MLRRVARASTNHAKDPTERIECCEPLKCIHSYLCIWEKTSIYFWPIEIIMCLILSYTSNCVNKRIDALGCKRLIEWVRCWEWNVNDCEGADPESPPNESQWDSMDSQRKNLHLHAAEILFLFICSIKNTYRSACGRRRRMIYSIFCDFAALWIKRKRVCANIDAVSFLFLHKIAHTNERTNGNALEYYPVCPLFCHILNFTIHSRGSKSVCEREKEKVCFNEFILFFIVAFYLCQSISQI